MNVNELVEMTDAYFAIKKELVGLTDDLLKYHILVDGGQPYSYEESNDGAMYQSMVHLAKSTGVQLFEMKHGQQYMTSVYLKAKLSELKEGRLNVKESILNNVVMDTYMFVDKEGISIYSVLR